MLSDTFLDDVSDVLQTVRQLSLFVVTESNVVSKSTTVSSFALGFLELDQSLVITFLFEQETTLSDQFL